MAREKNKIPQDPGVYWIDGKETKVLKVGEVTVHNDKGRSVLAKLSPIPMFPGKATLEMAGRPLRRTSLSTRNRSSYIQLSEPEGFGIIKLTPKGAIRIVENMNIHPIDKSMIEEVRIPVEILHRQLADDLYKIWARDPLEPPASTPWCGVHRGQGQASRSSTSQSKPSDLKSILFSVLSGFLLSALSLRISGSLRLIIFSPAAAQRHRENTKSKKKPENRENERRW